MNGTTTAADLAPAAFNIFVKTAAAYEARMLADQAHLADAGPGHPAYRNEADTRGRLARTVAFADRDDIESAARYFTHRARTATDATAELWHDCGAILAGAYVLAHRLPSEDVVGDDEPAI